MRVYADRIQVERGEEWTYDVYFQNRDGSPYIVSNQLTNPYILVTIASSKYTQTVWHSTSVGTMILRRTRTTTFTL